MSCLNKRMTASEMLPHSVSWLTHSWEVTAGGEGAHAWGEKPQICNILTNQPEFRKRQKDFIRSPEALKFDAFMMENTRMESSIGQSTSQPTWEGTKRKGLSWQEWSCLCLSLSWLNVSLTPLKITFLWLETMWAGRDFAGQGSSNFFLPVSLFMSDTVWNNFCVKTENV